MVFNVEIITWLHACLMVEPNPKTAQVFETRQTPSRWSGGLDEMVPDLQGERRRVLLLFLQQQ